MAAQPTHHSFPGLRQISKVSLNDQKPTEAGLTLLESASYSPRKCPKLRAEAKSCLSGTWVFGATGGGGRVEARRSSSAALRLAEKVRGRLCGREEGRPKGKPCQTRRLYWLQRRDLRLWIFYPSFQRGEPAASRTSWPARDLTGEGGPCGAEPPCDRPAPVSPFGSACEEC